MMRIASLCIAAALIAAAAGLCGCTAQEPAAGDIMEIAVDDGRFTTFINALNETDLSGTLHGEGPFTVFAPTDQAIDALPPETREALFEGPRENVTRLLQYHIVSGRYRESDVEQLNRLTTLEGNIFRINTTGGVILVDGVRVSDTNIMASNGVIHAIDGVMVPPDGSEADLPVPLLTAVRP